MISSFLLMKHFFHILLMILIIHKYESLLLFQLLIFFLSFFNSCRVHEFSFFLDLFLRHETYCSLLFNEPLVDLFQIIQLVRLVIRNDQFSQHFLKASMKLDHVVKVYTKTQPLFLLFATGSVNFELFGH